MGEGKGFTFSDISLVGSLSSKLIYLFSVNECFTYMYVNTPCACLWRRLIEVFFICNFHEVTPSFVGLHYEAQDQLARLLH